MGYTPRQIVDYIFDNEYEADFLTSIALHKGNYSIGEIADKRFKEKDGVFKFISNSYNINIDFDDEDVIRAVKNGLYVSAFVSRFENAYQVHFLVHQYPESMKSRFEDEIAKDVVRYIVTKTVLALRLDSLDKVKAYIKS